MHYMKFLLYGANGYTGELIARAAKKYGLTPILAGRSEEKIRPLAEELGYEFRIFDLTDQQALDGALRETPVVLHAAGPFIRTARPMLEGCLRTGVHYLDITGEIPVFELAHSLDGRARHAGILIMPGVGFDVVPTDCLALHLKNCLPDATHLKIAFASAGGGLSHGTATTMAENLGNPSAVRREGVIVPVPMGHQTMWVPFPDRERFCMTIPWGDVSTAFYTTGIPNIETYTGISPSSYRFVRLQRYFGWLLRTGLVRQMAKKRVDNAPAGPDADRRRTGRSLVWAEVRNAAGVQCQARLTGPEGYTLTVATSLLITQKVLSGKAPVGFQTPAGAFGADLILEVEGVERQDL